MLSVASGRCAAPLPVGAGEAIPGAADALRNGAHAITIAATSTEMSGIKILLRSRGMLNDHSRSFGFSLACRAALDT